VLLYIRKRNKSCTPCLPIFVSRFSANFKLKSIVSLLLGFEASTLSSDDDKEMKSYMDQMDEELEQTTIGESFEKVNLLLTIKSCYSSVLTCKADNHSQSLRRQIVQQTNQKSRQERAAVTGGKHGKYCSRQNFISQVLHVIG